MDDIRALFVDIAAVAAAVVGAVGFLVGLGMCLVAFLDARRAAPKPAGDGSLQPLGVPADVVKVLPELIKTAAGVAVAVLLLSTVLLTGLALGGAGNDAASAESRPLAAHAG